MDIRELSFWIGICCLALTALPPHTNPWWLDVFGAIIGTLNVLSYKWSEP